MGTHLMGCSQCGQVNLVAFSATDVAATPVRDARESVTRFVASECVIGPGLRADTASVLAAYRQWCGDHGVDALSPQGFGRALVALCDVERVRSNGRRFYGCLALAE